MSCFAISRGGNTGNVEDSATQLHTVALMHGYTPHTNYKVISLLSTLGQFISIVTD